MDAGWGWSLFILALIGGAVYVLKMVRKKMYGDAPKQKGLIR